MDRQEYSQRLQFEHELISRRIGWLLTSQTILFAAYGVILGEEGDVVGLFRTTIPFLGAAVSVFVLFGILASFAAKFCTWQDFRKEPSDPLRFD